MSKISHTVDSSKSPKPKKPRPDFPLFPHASGRWAKKVRGKFLYFGKVADDPKGEAALEKWLNEKDERLAGRTPRAAREGRTVKELLNHFLTAKRHLLDTGELGNRTFGGWYGVCDFIGRNVGLNRLIDDLAGDDFDKLRRKMALSWGPVRLGNMIQGIRSVFKYAVDARLIEKPVHYGATFKRPAKSVLRKARATKGPRMFEAIELKAILGKATQPLCAMILLGINCGFGNGDVASLPMAALNLQTGWVNFPRPKTGIERRCPLWPETIKALKEAEAGRPAPKSAEAANLVFVTRCGAPWFSSRLIEKEDGRMTLTTDDPVSKEFTKLIKVLELHRPGLGFYALRHGFETIAGASRDQVAVDAIMGHSRNDMASVYREQIGDDRLVAVADHVRKWLFGAENATPTRRRAPRAAPSAAKPKANAKPAAPRRRPR